ncbi:Hypothetical predicted protein [Olea europaea subsp. europaea]|uniref:Uncharacterized protein n=1 Tax=Olea europaea subsp. europaea TaxID=158383 RepID=A0A8S0PBR7_OLEEU|nr:Hypothetical predicted protein [Olea europaea subsp. europaea]
MKMKSRSARKPQMVSNPEMDAALQLIQLSGDSDYSKENHGGHATKSVEQNREESVGDSNEISSTFIRELKTCPKRKRRYRSIDDLYSVTKPVIIKKRGKKIRN